MHHTQIWACSAFVLGVFKQWAGQAAMGVGPFIVTGPNWMSGEELVLLVCRPATFLLHMWYLVNLQNTTVPFSPLESAAGQCLCRDHLPA